MEIPGYNIIRELGRGGMATVFLANQERLHRQVALKVMRPIEGAVDDFTERFIKEGQIIAQLQHRSIVTIYDFNSNKKLRYFSMEHLPGGTLAERIEEGLSTKQTLAILRCIAEALSYAHARGIIHRDLKPQNIMFRDDGSPVLTDFGIARVVNANSDTTRLTRFGMAIGSPRYMSPEQITGQIVDARADLYSLGIVFYEMLTKELPYRADDAISLAMMHCSSPMPPLIGQISNFQSILEKLTAKKADDRFADAKQLIQALDELDSGNSIPGSNNDETRIFGSSQSFPELISTDNTGRSKKRIGIASVSLLSVALAVAAYWMVFRTQKQADPTWGIELPHPNKDRPEIAAHYEKLALALFRQRKFGPSMDAINQGLSVTRGDSRLKALQIKVQASLEISKLVQNAKRLAEESSLEQSLKLIRQALVRDPNQVDALTMRDDLLGQIVEKARNLLKEGEPTASLKLIESGLEIIPDHTDLSRLRTEVMQDIQRQAEIAGLLSEARALLQSGQLDESLARVDKGLEMDSGNPEFHALRASIEERQLQTRNARADELLEQAWTQNSQGDPGRGLELVEEGLSLVSTHSGLQSFRDALIAKIAQQQRRSQLRQHRANEFLSQAREQQQRRLLDKAMELVESGLQQMPTDTALLNLEQTLAEQIKLDHQVAQFIVDVQKLVDKNFTEQGLALVKRGLELAPSNEQLKELERNLMAQQHLQSLLSECSSRFPPDPSLGDTAEAAIACYQQVIELDPQNVAAGKKQEEIADQLPDGITRRLQSDDLGNADKLIALLKRISPQHPELAALHKARAAAQETRLALDLSQRRMVQTWLNALEYPVGTPDGAFEAQTRQAISGYQNAIGVESTGFLSAKVHSLLEEQGSAKLRRALLPEMADIAGGCFLMGSPTTEAARDQDERQHKVCVDSFRLGKREISVKEFRRFVEATNYQTDAERNAWGEIGCWALDAQSTDGYWSYRDWANWRNPNKYQETEEDHPVACVSWNDAQAYVGWLSRESGAAIRLPTEAEWEYAARAGTTGTRFWGTEQNQAACNYASVADQGQQWADGFPCDDSHEWVAPVGERQPNGWGLYDIFGNVWEWTCSAYDQEYTGKEAACSTNIEAPRVLRGGSWYSGPQVVRAAHRDRNYLGTRYSFLGFRIAED